MSEYEKILKVLDDLLRSKDVYACMVAKRGMEGVIPDSSKFNPKVMDMWETLQNTIDNEFTTIKEFSGYGLGEVTFRMQEFEVLLYILSGSDTALIAVTPALANKGLTEVTMENARRSLVEIIQNRL